MLSNGGKVMAKEETDWSFVEEDDVYTWSSKGAEVEGFEYVEDGVITVNTVVFISLLATEGETV